MIKSDILEIPEKINRDGKVNGRDEILEPDNR